MKEKNGAKTAGKTGSKASPCGAAIPFFLVYGASSLTEKDAPLECYAGYPTMMMAQVYVSNFSRATRIVPGKFIPSKGRLHNPRGG